MNKIFIIPTLFSFPVHSQSHSHLKLTFHGHEYCKASESSDVSSHANEIEVFMRERMEREKVNKENRKEKNFNKKISMNKERK